MTTTPTPRPTPATVFGRRPPSVLSARPVTRDTWVPAPRQAVAGPASWVARYTAAVLGSDLPTGARRIALVLADRANPRTGRIPDQVQVGVRTLAAITGMGESPVRTCLIRLERERWIRRTSTSPHTAARIELLLMPDRDSAR